MSRGLIGSGTGGGSPRRGPLHGPAVPRPTGHLPRFRRMLLHPTAAMTRILTLSLLALTGACGQTHNVMFSPAPLGEPPTVRVHFDREGQLYPRRAVDTVRLRGSSGASLRSYYRQASTTTSPEWMALLRHYQVADGPFDLVWERVQGAIREDAAVRLRRMNAPLLVLIHGFNNTRGEASAAYETVRAVLAERGGDAARGSILEVYWDGHTARGAGRRDAWMYAQHNAYHVGVELRRVLREIPRSTPVRILSHSHGGKVAAVALWNVESSVDRGRTTRGWQAWYDAVLRDTVRYRRPEHPDVRLAMIVPAMPGNVIGDLDSLENRDVPGVRPTRVIVARNRHDVAVGKHFFGLGGLISSAWGGATTLGARPDEYEKYASVLNRPGGPVVGHCLDYSGTSIAPRVHDWTVYMRREATRPLLDLLFGEGGEGEWSCGR